MTIEKKLNNYLQDELKPISHKSLNRTFIGYSNLFQQKVFVKQFAKKQGWYTEKKVTEQLNDRVLAALSLDQKYILMLKDTSPKDIDENITSDIAFKMGQVLGDFHTRIKPFSKIKIVKDQFDGYLTEINTFNASTYKRQLLTEAKKFEHHKKEIQDELLTKSKFVLHGDVGIRNYKYVNDKLVLIDFEKARLGPVYQDFIKLFYQDFKLNLNLIAAFLRGYSNKNSDYELSDLTKQYLIFTTAIGIFNYTEKIEDLPFKQIGEKMLETLRDGL